MKELTDLWSMLIIAGVISFLGFILENIWLIITKGYADNRNMNLPFLLGYAIVVLGMYFLYGTPSDIGRGGLTHEQRYILYFIAAFFTVSVGEILLGSFVERFFGFEYWNYTRLPLHITKYTSIPTSTGFALIITEFMDKCFPRLLELTYKAEPFAAACMGITLAVLMLSDFIISFRKMYRSRSLNVTHTIRIFPKGLPQMLRERREARRSQ